MSVFTRYAAHSELCSAIHANEDVEMLIDMHDDQPDLFAYPISGDMLAVLKRSTSYARKQRRKLAAIDRRYGA